MIVTVYLNSGQVFQKRYTVAIIITMKALLSRLSLVKTSFKS